MTIGAEQLSTGATDNKGITTSAGTVAANIPVADTISFNSAVETIRSAQSAVTALSNAVAALGKAQAVVGKGENQYT